MARKVEPTPNSDSRNLAKTFSLIGDAKLKQLYAAMLQCRLLDERLRQTAGPAKPKQLSANLLSSMGYEAAIVGAAIHLRRQDWLLPQHLTAVAGLLRGKPLSAILAKSHTGLPTPAQPAAEPLPPIPPLANIVPATDSLAAQLNIAVGLALAAQSREKDHVVMAFCESDRAASPQIAEPLRLAASRQLPLLLLLLPAKSGPSKPSASSKKNQAANLVEESRASAIPVIPVDHADIVAIYRVAFESIHKARHNGGPTLIEAAIWPFPDKPHPANKPAPTDPLAKMEAYLTAKGLFSERWKKRLVDRFHTEVALP